jgi:tetratricopeptide (TPR) repeat protein
MLSDLSTTPIAETLRRLSAERRSGDLQVRSGKVVKTVFFDHGRIVFAASNMKKDRLGEALVAIGRITDDDFNRASALMGGDRKRRFGEALVQAGVLESSELGRLVARQVKRIVLSLFELTSGVGLFEERRCPIPLEYMVSLSIHRLLYVGIKTMKSAALVTTGLGDLDRWVTLASVPPFKFGVKKCSQEELDILEQAKRRVTIRRLAWAPGGLSPVRLRAAYALIAAGVLEEVSTSPGQAPAEPQPVVQMETSTFLLSALQRRPDPSVSDAIRQEVDVELERSSNLDRVKWLRVSRTAPAAELTKALEEKMERYHALLEAVGDDEGLRTDIELIIGRASSMTRLARQAPANNVIQVLDAATPPMAIQVPQPRVPEARKEKPSAPKVESKPKAAPKPVPKPVPVPEPEPEPDLELEQEPEPKPEPKPEPAPAPELLVEPEPEPLRPMSSRPPRTETGSMAGASNFEGSAQIEHLLMEGSVRMTVSDYANAVTCYQKLVDVAPKVASFRVRLGIAMAFYPRTQRQAEREFFEATRLEPDNPDIHFQFGLYYKAMRVRSRAIAELRTAVRLNPRHKQAREELEALSPRDSALTSLKKFLK